MRLLIGSYAWIELFENSPKGKLVEKYLETHECMTLSITVAELISKLKRKNNIDLTAQMISSNTKIIPIDHNLAELAGQFHAEIRRTIKNFGMGDAFLLAAARKFNTKILTGDSHFKEFKEVVLL